MDVILPEVVAGLFLGAFFGLVAVGYSMVYGVLRLINFAHGDFYMVAAYVSYSLLLLFGVAGTTNWGNFILVGLATMVVGGLLAVAVERLIYRPMRGAATLSLMIAALGVSLVLENGVLNLPFWGSKYRAYPVTPPSAGFDVLGVHLAWVQVLIIAIGIALIALVYWIVNKTLVGLAMRAVSQDRVAAALMGIEIDRVIAIVFFIGGALAGAAAVMASLYYGQISYLMGFYVGLQAFTAAVLGGIGNVLGAAVGGFLLGILEAVGTGLIGPQWALLFAFSILVLTLWVRPTGLLGERVGQRV
jgi:Branched-chain amino acid ABC-type transport system, permease components